MELELEMALTPVVVFLYSGGRYGVLNQHMQRIAYLNTTSPWSEEKRAEILALNPRCKIAQIY